MTRNDGVLIPVAFVKRWLEESEDTADFERRFDHYVATHKSNWEIP